MCRLSDRMSKAATLNCRRATDGSITAKVNAERRKRRRGETAQGGYSEVEDGEGHRYERSGEKRKPGGESSGAD